MKPETVYLCGKCNSGRHCLRDCQYQQFNEQEKLRDYSVTDSEGLPTKLWNKLIKKIVGERPVINCYLNDEKVKGFGIGDLWQVFWEKKWLSEMLRGVPIISLKQFMGVLDHILSPIF